MFFSPYSPHWRSLKGFLILFMTLLPVKRSLQTYEGFSLWELLNISFPWQIQAQEETAIISWRECSKKHALSLSEGSAQQGRSHFDARSVQRVREHGKMGTCLREALRRRQGTPLAAIFNIPSIVV